MRIAPFAFHLLSSAFRHLFSGLTTDTNKIGRIKNEREKFLTLICKLRKKAMRRFMADFGTNNNCKKRRLTGERN